MTVIGKKYYNTTAQSVSISKQIMEFQYLIIIYYTLSKYLQQVM